MDYYKCSRSLSCKNCALGSSQGCYFAMSPTNALVFFRYFIIGSCAQPPYKFGTICVMLVAQIHKDIIQLQKLSVYFYMNMKMCNRQ